MSWVHTLLFFSWRQVHFWLKCGPQSTLAGESYAMSPEELWRSKPTKDRAKATATICFLLDRRIYPQMRHTAVMGYMEILQLRQSLIKDYTFKIQGKLLPAASLAASATVLEHKVGNTCILLLTWFPGVALPLESIETAQPIRISTIRFVPGSAHWNLTGPWISPFWLRAKATLYRALRESDKGMEELSSKTSLTKLDHLHCTYPWPQSARWESPAGSWGG